MILTPLGEDDLQVQILGALARIMMESQNRRNLMKANDSEHIREILATVLKSQ
jgi:mannitol/fructose-specific phosphotransferase system IIA component (Ntr-type)